MRSIIVTGGSRGIGSEICTTLSKAGYAVAINYNHSAEKALVLCKRNSRARWHSYRHSW